MIDRFSKAKFEQALPVHKESKDKLWKEEGLIGGEYCYSLKVNDFARVMIRSSVDESGFARDTGDDSIRLWAEVLVVTGEWRAMPKLDAYTTRVNGWPKRMVEKLQELWGMAAKIKRPVERCEQCGRTKVMWRVSTGPKAGRYAMKCIDCDKGFAFMDEEAKWVTANPTNDVPSASQAPGTPTEPFSAGSSGDAEHASASTSSSPEKSESSSNHPDDLLSELSKIANDAFNSTPKSESRGQANEQQLACIQAPMDRAIRVLASPGSGKTFCIERRYAHLLANGVSPRNIVAVTFSAAMAADLQSRILKHNKEVAGTGAENQICTIHALCARILVAEGLGKQVPKTWQMKKIVQELIGELWEYSTKPQYARPNWDEVLRAFANAKANYLQTGQDAAFYEQLWGEYHAERLTLARQKFDSSMGAQGLWTFNDMLYECERLLMTNQGVLEKYQTRYQYIIVDEGQDTNHQAMRILTLLAKPQDQLFIVGDPDQLLFRFTGATPEENLYEGFTSRYPDGLMFMLETNYRSTHNIVERSNRLISKNYAGEGGPYNEVFHKIVNAREDAIRGLDISFQNYEEPALEGYEVAKQIALMIEQGRKPGDFFVGARTRAMLGYLEGPLMQAGVPFINITGGSFWQQSHIANTLAYVKLALDNNDQEAFQRIYNISSAEMKNRDGEYCATRYLGRAFLESVDNKYNPSEMRYAASNRYAWNNGVNDLIRLVGRVEAALQRGVGYAIETVIDLCMKKWLMEEEGLAEDDSESGKLADLDTVVDVAKKFKTAEEFFDKVEEMIEAAKAAKEKRWDDYVVISTIHRLKGMERPVVFGTGWSEGEMFIDGHMIKVGMLPHTFSLTPPPITGVLDIGSQSLVEDERCMAFVLVTRAKEEVYLSGVEFWRKAMMHPSRFIEEMGLLEFQSEFAQLDEERLSDD